MAIAKIVPEKDWEVLREYLNGSDVVLIKESVAKNFQLLQMKWY